MRLRWSAFWENASKSTCKPLFTLFFLVAAMAYVQCFVLRFGEEGPRAVPALYFGWPALRNRHFVIRGGGGWGGAGEHPNPPITFCWHPRVTSPVTERHLWSFTPLTSISCPRFCADCRLCAHAIPSRVRVWGWAWAEPFLPAHLRAGPRGAMLPRVRGGPRLPLRALVACGGGATAAFAIDVWNIHTPPPPCFVTGP